MQAGTTWAPPLPQAVPGSSAAKEAAPSHPFQGLRYQRVWEGGEGNRRINQCPSFSLQTKRVIPLMGQVAHRSRAISDHQQMNTGSGWAGGHLQPSPPRRLMCVAPAPPGANARRWQPGPRSGALGRCLFPQIKEKKRGALPVPCHPRAGARGHPRAAAAQASWTGVDGHTGSPAQPPTPA